MNYPEYRLQEAELIPDDQRCPECDGHGLLWLGFNDHHAVYVDCLTCDGTGHA